MRVYLDNVDVSSSSGPNSFGKKLLGEMKKRGIDASTDPSLMADAQLSFITLRHRRSSKLALRLDGIYFNTRQNWEDLNAPLASSCSIADLVIYQSHFNKRLTEKYFGEAKRSVVIGNGADIGEIDKILPAVHPSLDKFDEVWCCSSSWRPHKRLKDNIDYFHSMKQNNAALIVLGENPDHISQYSDVLYTGKLPWETCISVYKRSKKFLHLAFLDHCPNVVVDARASGCEIVVASSGGTREIAGPEATVVEDLDWDMRPLDLYSPPPLDYTKSFKNCVESSIDIRDVASKYIDGLTNL